MATAIIIHHPSNKKNVIKEKTMKWKMPCDKNYPHIHTHLHFCNWSSATTSFAVNHMTLWQKK